MSRRASRRRQRKLYQLYVIVAGSVLAIVVAVALIYLVGFAPPLATPAPIPQRTEAAPATETVITEQPATAPPAVSQPPTMEFVSAQPAINTAPTEQSAIVDMKIQLNGTRENEYVMTGTGMETVALGDLLVVYVHDVAGYQSDVAIVYIVDKNRDSLLAKVLFKNPDVELDSLAALRADKNLADANLTRMVAIGTAFVGFVVGPNQIRLNPNEPIHSGTKLLVVKLTANGDAIKIQPPLVLQISEVSIDKEMANASVNGYGSWPPVGTLLIPENASNTYQISVNDFSSLNEICVRRGDLVKVIATGMIVVGEFVGALGPEGKERFQLFGVPTPIDPLWDIIPEFPHGALMYRIGDPAQPSLQGWLHYGKIPEFVADKSGCLEFDINDNDNSDNGGSFTVQIQVNP